MNVPLTPLEFRERAVRLFGNKVGVIDGGSRFTYRDFGERTNRLSNALLDLGLQPGDRVAYLAYNSHPLLEGYYGVLQARGVLLPLNIRLSSREIAYILNDASVRVLFIDPDFGDVLDGIASQLDIQPETVWLAPTSRPGPVYEELLAASSAAAPTDCDIDENSVAELFYTSGTTGRPKGVMLTHRSLYLHSIFTLATIAARDDEVQLHTIPLFHVNGWGTPQSLTAIGGTHVMLRKFDPGDALKLIQFERVTRFFAVPTMLNMMLDHPDLGEFDLSSLRLVMLGGAPTPKDLVRRGEEMLGCTIGAGYGLSETSPVLTFASVKSYLETDTEGRIGRQASTGLPIVGVDARVVDETGAEVPWDGATIGEIVARSNVVMEGYWNDPEGTSAVIRDGWFHTGDVAVVDDEGYIVIVDRMKDIIISGGENISSVEIEKVLFEHPAVMEAAVVGVPDDRWGEVPKALVALRSGHVASDTDLIDHCRARIASFKVPRTVEFFDALPKGGTGKILKARLREPYWVGRDKQVH